MISRGLLILLLLYSNLCFGQKFFVRKVIINSDQNDIIPRVMAQDEKGFMYIGTNKGLYRFDGANFRYIEGLSQLITALHYQNSTLYIGYSDGTVAQLYHNKFSKIATKGIKINTEISSIYCSKENNQISLSTKGQGVVLLNESGYHFLNTKNNLSDNYVYNIVQEQNIIWASTDKGVNKIIYSGHKSVIKQFTTSNGIIDNIVSRIAVSANSSKICLAYQQGALSVHDSTFSFQIGGIQNTEWGQINDVLFENNEQIWAGTGNGKILQIEIGTNKLILKDTIQLGASVHNLHKDIAGNIWVATDAGLYEIVAPNISKILIPLQTYKLSNVSAITNVFDSLIFFAMQQKLYCYNVNSNKTRECLSAQDIITKIFRIHDELWIGTMNMGIWKFNFKQNEVEKFSIAGLPQNAHILDINNDENNLWIASLEGLFQCKKNPQNREQFIEVKKHDKQGGLGSDYVYQIFIDRKKRVWFATDGGGPAVFDQNKLTSWKKKIPQLKSDVVYSIDESADGKIWMTSLSNGIFSYDEQNWVQFGKNYGLGKGDFLGLVTQPNWHVIAIQSDALLEYFPKQNFFRKYNKQSGITLDSLSQNINLVSKNERGDVIIPNQHGFIYLKSQTEQKDQTSQIRIVAVQSFLKDIPFGQNQFDYSENQISFEFESSNFTHTEKLYYRYRLNGLSNQWITTNDKKITYSKLPSGTYVFEVQVAHNLNFNSVQSDSYEFNIEQPYWQSWWFYFILLLILAYGIWAYVRFRESGVRKFESIQKERLNFEYEQLKSQVNPHFLFNSLNTLVDLIDEDAPRAADYTIHLAAMYRTLLSFRDKELISIKEEIGLLEHYTFVQKCRFGDALQIEIDIVDYVAEKYKIVPLALQLLVENAIKHNEVSKANPLKILISLTGYQIIIVNQLRPKISEEKGEGFGISNLQSRYLLLADREIEIKQENNNFIVKLPLL